MFRESFSPLSTNRALSIATSLAVRVKKDADVIGGAFEVIGKYMPEQMRTSPVVAFITLGWPKEQNYPFFLLSNADILVRNRLIVDQRMRHQSQNSDAESNEPSEEYGYEEAELNASVAIILKNYESPDIRWGAILASVLLEHLDLAYKSAGSYVATAALLARAQGLIDLPIAPETLDKCGDYWFESGVLGQKGYLVSVHPGCYETFGGVVEELLLMGIPQESIEYTSALDKQRYERICSVWLQLRDYLNPISSRGPGKPAPHLPPLQYPDFAS